MNTTSQDILNLANAYAVIRENKNQGNGYMISDRYGDKILEALERSTDVYKKMLERAAQAGEGER